MTNNEIPNDEGMAKPFSDWRASRERNTSLVGIGNVRDGKLGKPIDGTTNEGDARRRSTCIFNARAKPSTLVIRFVIRNSVFFRHLVLCHSSFWACCQIEKRLLGNITAQFRREPQGV